MTFAAEHVSFAYRDRNRSAHQVFRDLCMRIAPGEAVGLIGAEGSGKSTLLQLLDGLLVPDRGEVMIDGIRILAGRDSDGSFRKRIGMTFQFPDEQFLCDTVVRECETALAVGGVPPGQVRTAAETLLRRVGLDPAVGGRSPFTLSVGESRRLALALILASRREAAILDEPTAGLDADGVRLMVRELRALHEEGTTLIVATHDVDLVAETLERVIVLDGGTIVLDGRADVILCDDLLLSEHGYPMPEAAMVAQQLRQQGKPVPVGLVRRGALEPYLS
ncbi:MAG: ATP-binding cassette domain-containing protein [Bacteroidota bacterium]